MKKLFVKICGMTRAQDAELAANLGASALGFVFWPDSPRYVDARTVTAMTANVSPSVLKVGVFVDQPVADVARMMDEAGLDVAQLHGHESPEYCRQLMVRLKADTTEARVDTTEAKYFLLHVRRERRQKRYGNALQLLLKHPSDAPNLFHSEKRRDLCELLCWTHLYEFERRWFAIKFPAGYEPF